MKCERCGHNLSPLVSDTGQRNSEYYCSTCRKSYPMSQEAWDFFQSTKNMKRPKDAISR